MNSPRSRLVASMLLVFSLALASAAPVQAEQNWPERPIQIISSGAPGGTSDVIFRALQQPLVEALGQQLLIINKPGAGGMLAGDFTAKAPPDGYTFFITHIGVQGTGPALYKKLNFNPLTDLKPVARLAILPNVLYVNANLGVKSVQELIAYAKANPGKVNYATSGAGASPHLSTVLFAKSAGIELTHVPYRASAPAVQGMLSREVDMSFENISAVIPLLKAGTLRALGVTTAVRSSQLPDVPTITEAGVPGFDVSSWFGIAAPAKTPDAIVKRLSDEIINALARQDVQDKLRLLGAEPAPLPSSDFGRFIATETERWRPIVEASGAAVE